MRPDIVLDRQDKICAFAAALLRLQDYALRVVKQDAELTAAGQPSKLASEVEVVRKIAIGSTVMVNALARSPERVCVYDPDILPECELRDYYRMALLALSQELLEWHSYVNNVPFMPWVVDDFAEFAPRGQTQAQLRDNIVELVNLFDMYNHV